MIYKNICLLQIKLLYNYDCIYNDLLKEITKMKYKKYYKVEPIRYYIRKLA